MLLSYIYRFKSFAYCSSVIIVDPSSFKLCHLIYSYILNRFFGNSFRWLSIYRVFDIGVMYVRQNAFTEMSHMIFKSVYSTTIDCTNSSRWNAAGNEECVLKHCLLKFCFGSLRQ